MQSVSVIRVYSYRVETVTIIITFTRLLSVKYHPVCGSVYYGGLCFSPALFFINFSHFCSFMVVWGLGFWDWGLELVFWGYQ